VFITGAYFVADGGMTRKIIYEEQRFRPLYFALQHSVGRKAAGEFPGLLWPHESAYNRKTQQIGIVETGHCDDLSPALR